MNKTIMLITVWCAAIINIYAFENLHFNVCGNEYAAGIEAYLDVSRLRMLERVYKDRHSGDLISELDWNIGLQAAVGTGFVLAPADPFNTFGLSLGGMCRWYFPVNNRNMHDTDWDDNGNVFNYGESIASSIAGTDAEGRLAAIFPIKGRYVIEAAAELWYGRYAVTAHDGWINRYGDTEKIPLYGAAVEYFQEWTVFAPGIGFGLKLNNSHISLNGAVSPFIRGCHIDCHYFRKPEEDDPEQKYMNYTDNTAGGVYYRVQAGWLWNVTRSVQTGIAVNYRAIENSRGDTTITTAGFAGYSFLEKGMAGAAIRTITIGLTIRTVL